jgi:hypothetical protein
VHCTCCAHTETLQGALIFVAQLHCIAVPKVTTRALCPESEVDAFMHYQTVIHKSVVPLSVWS